MDFGKEKMTEGDKVHITHYSAKNRLAEMRLVNNLISDSCVIDS